MTTTAARNVRNFPIDAHPTGEELEALRAEFVSYQYKFSPFSDHYSVVARFAWEKLHAQAIEAQSGETGTGSTEGESAVGNADASKE